MQAVAIEAWGRREAEQLSVDKVEWAAMSAAAGLANPGGRNGARLRLLDGVPKDEHDFMPSYLAPVLRLSPRSAGRRYETARVLVGLLPRTLAAMRAGDLEPHRAQQVVDEVPSNDPAVCAAVEAGAVPADRGQADDEGGHVGPQGSRCGLTRPLRPRRLSRLSRAGSCLPGPVAWRG